MVVLIVVAIGVVGVIVIIVVVANTIPQKIVWNKKIKYEIRVMSTKSFEIKKLSFSIWGSRAKDSTFLFLSPLASDSLAKGRPRTTSHTLLVSRPRFISFRVALQTYQK